MNSYDLQFPILLTLEEASQGTQRDFFYPARELLCSRCGGFGKLEDNRCDVCEGSGRTLVPKKITVNVPVGVNDQVRIRINGQGLLSPDFTEWGDLYLVCYIRPHPIFQREAFDLIVTADSETRGNGKLTVKTLAGPVDVPLPDGFSEESIRLAGHGLPRRIGGGDRGDLVIRFVTQTPAMTPDEFRSLKIAATERLHVNDFEHVIQILDSADCALLHDAESNSILGHAHEQLNDLASARKHFIEAAALEPGNASHSFHLGVLAARQQDYLGAAMLFESALCIDRSQENIKSNLYQVLHQVFNPLLCVFGDRRMNEQVQHACNLAQHRSYASAGGMMGTLRAARPDAVRLTFMQAAARLLGCHTGHEEFLAEVVDLFDVLAALHPGWDEPCHARRWALTYAERDGGLVGLLTLAHYEARRGQFGEACRLMQIAVTRAQSLPPADSLLKNQSDPLAGKTEALIRQNIESFKQWLSARRDDVVEIPFLKGLMALVECHVALRRTGQVGPGWLPAVHAVNHLELAVCQSPDRLDINAQFQHAVDTFSGIASAKTNEMNPDLVHFFQNSYDAAIQSLIPESPLNRIVQSGDSSLRQACEEAFGKLFENSRTPLRGEFLVAPLDLHFVLTNYRLLLLTDRLPNPQLLPLNGISRYTTRASGLNLSTLIIDLEGGKQLILNNVPNGAFPRDSLVNYLIAARMWERLKSHEQHILVTGHGRSDALPDVDRPARQALPSVGSNNEQRASQQSSSTEGIGASACTNCGNAVQPTDLFCRHCGSRVAAAVTIDPSRMLGTGD